MLYYKGKFKFARGLNEEKFKKILGIAFYNSGYPFIFKK